MIPLLLLGTTFSVAHAALPAWQRVVTNGVPFTVGQDENGYVLTPGAGFGCVLQDETKPAGANITPTSCEAMDLSVVFRSEGSSIVFRGIRKSDVITVPYVDLTDAAMRAWKVSVSTALYTDQARAAREEGRRRLKELIKGFNGPADQKVEMVVRLADLYLDDAFDPALQSGEFDVRRRQHADAAFKLLAQVPEGNARAAGTRRRLQGFLDSLVGDTKATSNAPVMVGGPTAANSALAPYLGAIPGTLQGELLVNVLDGTCNGKPASEDTSCAVSHGKVFLPAGGFGVALLQALTTSITQAPQACEASANPAAPTCDNVLPLGAEDEGWLRASGCARAAGAPSPACGPAVEAWRGAIAARRTAIVTSAIAAMEAGPTKSLPTTVAKALAAPGTLPEDSRTALRQRALDLYAAQFDKLVAQQPSGRAVAVAGATDPYAFKGDTVLQQLDDLVKAMSELEASEQGKARALRLAEERKLTFIAKFDKAMLAQPALRVQKAPADSPDWYKGEANLKRIEEFLAQLDVLDTTPLQAARRARFEREKTAQQVLADAAQKQHEAQVAAQEAREARAAPSSGGGSSGSSSGCDAPLSGPFGSLVINGRALTCNTLIYQCQVQRPSDVAYCMSSTLGPAGISGDACFSCWR